MTYYYCTACGSVWYIDGNNAKYYASAKECETEIIETAEDKNCGCNN